MQESISDIRNRNDIKVLVDRFYEKVRRNEILAPVFEERIPDEHWPVHLEKIYDFWNAILFSEKGFQGNPMQKHLSLPITEQHFAQWLGLFTQTVDESFAGPKAEKAKWRAASIAQIMNLKIGTLRK